MEIWKTSVLPDMSLRKMIPQLKGSNTHAYASNLPPHVNAARKVLHLEIGKQHIELIAHLVRIAKDTGIFEAWWGKIVHPTQVLELDASKKEKDALDSMAHDHTCFICAVRTERLVGIARLDKKVPVYGLQDGKRVQKGTFSLRMILLDHLETESGRKVIGSIHQRGTEDPYVVIPNEAAVESLILRMNHQLPAFLLHVLPKKGIPIDYVHSLLKASCDPALYDEAQKCKWDDKNWIVIRPNEAELAAEKKREEEASQWYKGFVNMHLASNTPTTKDYVSPEARYDLEGDRSVHTIHQSSDSKRSAKTSTKGVKSKGDGDSPGVIPNTDSASKNAMKKPYSTVGFGTEQVLGNSQSSSSDEDDAHSEDGDSLSSGSTGTGG